MTWIDTISYDNSEGKLRKLYDRVKGPDDNVDNIMLAHSLRPHTMEGHMTLYKYVLHHPRNTIEKWFLEAIGTYTSWLNRCDYCFMHHYTGMKRLLNDDKKSEKMKESISSGDLANAFNSKEVAALNYTAKLTLESQDMAKQDIQTLREAGYNDGEILEINQVVAYFNYANRTVLGLGIHTEGDILGLSPGDSEDMDNWNHT